MEVDLYLLEVFQDIKKRHVRFCICLFQDEIHVSDRLMVVDAENEIHCPLF